MALTASNNINLLEKAPDFSLLNTISGKVESLSDVKGVNGTVVLFICNHCPYVIHINDALVRIANEYQEKGIAFVTISSNDVAAYPQDGPEEMKKHAEELGYSFPYFYDESQQVAKDYDATCTPDLYLFDANLKGFYHGQLDESRPGSGMPVTGVDLKQAMDALLQGNPSPSVQIPSMGCNIKWK